MARGHGFSLAEIDSLLDVIKEIISIGPNEWDRVTEQHCSYYPGLGHTYDSLRRKFLLLYSHKKPTGDPSCPAYVRRAKQLWERIKQEMDISDGEPEPEDVDGEQVPEVDGSEDEVSSNEVVPRCSAVPRLPPHGRCSCRFAKRKRSHW